jgi:hypothetical protein
MIWANLLHLSYNMWADREVPAYTKSSSLLVRQKCARPFLRCDRRLWQDLTQRMVDAGLNMLVIDLGDGVAYRSHPEIAVRRAWSTEALREELARLRGMGLEPIPKLNFSTAHDAWLGPYARAVSTPTYYAVCGELVDEVIELFDYPRFFHLGYDEETAPHQREYAYAVMRQHELWWHDFLFFVERVERRDVRAWIWSDYAWNHPEVFEKRMPRSVLQSNWYYGTRFRRNGRHVKTYVDLDAWGFEQIPTASNWSAPENLAQTVAFSRKHLDPDRVLGYLQTPWTATLEDYRAHHEQAIDLVGEQIAAGRARGT